MAKLEGLAKGPEVRSRRSHLRRRLQTGGVCLADLIEGAGVGPEFDEAESVALGMKLDDLVQSTSPIIAGLLYEKALFTEARLGELSSTRRTAIATAIREGSKQ